MNKEITFACDKCGMPITKIEDGWVEWITVASEPKPGNARGFRLVHKHTAIPGTHTESCQYDQGVEFEKDGGTLADLPLSDFLGHDGLMELLLKLWDRELPMGEVLELIKRLHIPGYEQARLHFKAAINDGVFEPNTPPGFYSQRDINATLAFVKNRKKRSK